MVQLKKKKPEKTPPMASAEDSMGFPDESPASTATPATPATPKVKARPDVYTLLLGLSVGAMTIAVVLLFLHLNSYGPNPFSGMPRG